VSLAADFMEQNNWANLQIIEFCEGLDEALLDATAAGVYGSVRETLVHMIASLDRYLSAITASAPANAAVVNERLPWPGFEALKNAAAANGEGLREAAASMEDGAEVRSQFGGKEWRVATSLPVIQSFLHCTEHRSQIATVLSNAGVTAPELDAWQWGGSTGRLAGL